MNEPFPRINKWADIQKLIDAGGLTRAEYTVIEAAKAGLLATISTTRPTAKTDAVLIHAPLLRYLILGGCEDCQTETAGVQVQGAWIEGTLDLAFAMAAGPIGLFDCYLLERSEMPQLIVPALALNGTKLAKGLNAQGARIEGDVFLRGVEAAGEVRLPGVDIIGQLSCEGATLRNAFGRALNVEGAQIGGHILFKNVNTNGELRIAGATITGQLVCSGATLSNAVGHALNAQAAQIGGGVFFERLESEGEVSLSGAEIFGQLSCVGANFRNSAGDALNAQGAQISGDVVLRAASSDGELSLLGATIKGQLNCTYATLRNPNGRALNAQRATIKEGFIWLNVAAVAGALDLSSAHVSDLVDDAESWRKCEKLYLTGFTYDVLHGSADTATRLGWLAKGAASRGEFHPQPYEQLGKVLRDSGHRAEAREVMVAKEKRQRQHARESRYASHSARSRSSNFGNLNRDLRLWLTRCWDSVFGLVAGYGHKPQKAIGTLAVLIALTSIIALTTWRAGDFAPNSGPILISDDWIGYAAAEANPAKAWSENSETGKDYETFNALAYGADIVIPLISFGQEAAWAPSTSRSWWGWNLLWIEWVMTLIGWIVTAIGAAAVTGVIRRD